MSVNAALQKIFFLITYLFKEHVKFVKIYRVKFNVTICNGLKIMRFL